MTESLDPTDGSDPPPTIPVRYLREMLAGHPNPEPALAEGGLDVSVLASSHHRLRGVELAKVYRFVLRSGDDELFGALARRVPRGTFAALARIVTGCRDVRAVFTTASDVYRLFDEGHAHWTLEVEDEVATLTLHPRTEIQAASLLFTHVMLLSPWRTAHWVTGQPFPLRSVRLPVRYADFASETRFLFGCDPELVEAPSAITFDAAVLAWPIRRMRSEADAWTRRASFAAMLDRAPRDSLEAAVRRTLSTSSPFASTKLTEVASSLAMAPPTLSRRLRELGTTFQQIKDRLRRDHAISQLAQGASVAEVAEGLGFSEPSAFGRAFKQWTGSSPGAYRR